jgi:outer membrane protein assembly factor BamB
MSLQGELSEFPVGELLQTLTLNNHEGTLRVRTEKEGDRYFYLSKGEIQLVSPGKKGLRLGEALIKAKKITQQQLDDALQQHAETGRMLGKTLIELQLIAEDDIEQVIQQQFREEFFELFLLTKGAFEFFFRTKPDQLVQFDETVSRVSMNTSGLMLEALRQIDEWQEMSKAITTPRAILKVEVDDLEAAVEEMSPAEDVRQAVKLIDGRHNCQEIVEGTPATKFDVYAFLFQLLQKSAIRLLTHEECFDAAKAAEESGDTYAATLYYEFGAFLSPRDLDLRQRQFALLKRLAVYREAKEVALAIADVKLEERDHEQALSYYLEAQACDEKDIRAKEGIFRAAVMAGDKERQRAIKAGDDCVRAAIRQHDVRKAREILETLLELDPDAHRRRIQLADLLDDDTEGRKRAVALLEEAIAGLKRPEDAPLREEAARKILTIDARRADVQGTLREAVGIQEVQARRRVRNIILLNVVGVLLVIAAYVGSYELGARNAFADMAAKEPAALEAAARGLSAPLEEVVEGLRYVTRAYPRSTVASEAQASIARMAVKLDELKKAEQAKREEALRRARESDKEARKQGALELLRKAEALERKGGFREATEAKLEVVRDYGDVQLDIRIRLPVPITTDPPGARVMRGADELGKTPFTAFIEPLKEAKLRVELRGYEPVELALRGDAFEHADLTLARSSIWLARAAGAFETPPLFDRGRVIAASRDGEVYAFDAESGAGAWRLRLGEYGDRLSAPSVVGGKVLVGTTEGVLTSIDPGAGKPSWTYPAGAALRAEARASPDGLIAAVGAADGTTHFLRAATGERIFAARGEQRVEAPVGFGAGRAFIVARDGRVTAVDPATGATAWSVNLGAGASAAPVVADDVAIVAARDGTVTALQASDGKALWRVATPGRIRGTPVRAGSSLLVPSEDGHVYSLEPRSGALRWRFEADGPVITSPVVAEKGVYVVTTAGTIFRVDPAAGASTWKFSVGAPLHAGPAVSGGRLFVGAMDGTLRAVLE